MTASLTPGHTLGLGIREFLDAPSAIDDRAAPSQDDLGRVLEDHAGIAGGMRGRDDHDHRLLHRVEGLHLELHGVGEEGEADAEHRRRKAEAAMGERATAWRDAATLGVTTSMGFGGGRWGWCGFGVSQLLLPFNN